jgi:hypothetical protein
MFPMISQLTIRRRRMRNISGAKPGPSTSPPLLSTSASPRTSIPCGRLEQSDRRPLLFEEFAVAAHAERQSMVRAAALVYDEAPAP